MALPPSTTAPGIGYDAFISYNRKQDDWVAPALQHGLQRFAKPWHRMRGLRIFLDRASLAASPELWGSIEDALRASAWFILLASPLAAQSEWVDREVRWWLDNKSPGRILIVATASRLHWDKKAGDWTADSPVPPSLRGAFSAEPLWVDLTALQEKKDLRKVRVPDDDLATIAAPLWEQERDSLIGEHLRQHRRTIRVAQSAASALAVLLVFSIIATFVAVDQRNIARTQARIATSGELAAESQSLLGTHLDVARLLSVAAYQLDRTQQTHAALLQAGAASPHLVRFLQAGSTVTAMTSSADGKVLAVGTADGRLIRIAPATGQMTAIQATRTPITSLSLTADGHITIATDKHSVVTWTSGARQAVTVPGIQAPLDAGISPSGREIGVLQTAGSSSSSLLTRQANGSEHHTSVQSGFSTVKFPSDSAVVIADNGSNTWQRMNSRTLRMTSAATFPEAPAGDFVAAVSPDGSYEGYEKYGAITVQHTAGGITRGPTGRGHYLSGAVPDAPSSTLAIRPDGGAAAVAESGTVYVVPLTSRLIDVSRPTQLTGMTGTDQVSFLGHTSRLASASGATIALWDTAQDSELAIPTGFAVPFDSDAAPPPALLAPTSDWTSLVDGNGVGAWLFRGNRWRGQAPARSAVWELPMHDGGTPLLVGTTGWPGENGGQFVLADGAGRVLRSWPSTQALEDPVAADIMPGTGKFAVAGMDGSVRVFDIGTGTVRQLIEGSARIFVDAHNAAVSPDGRGVTLAESPWSGSPTDGQVRYVDLDTGATHAVGTGGAIGVTYTSQNLIIERSAGSIEVWDQAGSQLQRTFPGDQEDTGALTVSPDGTLLARLRQDGTLSVSNFATGITLLNLTLPAPTNSTAADPWSATAIQFTPDGHFILSATAGGKLIKWIVNPQDIERRICTNAGRSLSIKEWQQYTETTAPSHITCAHE